MSDAFWQHATVLAIVIASLLAGCSGERETESVPITPAAQAVSFVGSDACESCHADIVAGWRGSHHALAMQHATRDTVLGAFDGRSVDYFDEVAEFYRRGDAFVVRTLDAKGESREFPVLYTFGVEPLQQYLVEFPGGRLQALPWLWDTRPEAEGGQAWLHLYPDEYVPPGDMLHWTGRRQNWNFMCAECHSTNVVTDYSIATDSFETRFDELNVGCEACHGPASEHVRQAQSASFDSRWGLSVNLDDRGDAHWIMNADTGIAERSESLLAAPQQPEACGRCHARRGVLEEPYRYGEPLTDTHSVALLDDGLYFPDGQIHEEVYVYGSFVQSRMYRAGVTCTDCHDPHTAELKTGPDPNAACAQCHSPARFNTESHMGHEPLAASCVDCHMPARTYMVVDDRRDHSFRLPRPDLAEASDSPTACRDCHEAQTHAEAAAFIDRYRQRAPRAQFALALAGARRGHANAALVEVVRDAALPGIARATAAANLRSPFSENDRRAILLALADPDPLIRIGGLRGLRPFAPDQKAQSAGDLLGDPVLSVRIEAALSLANAFDYLDPAGRRAFNAAAQELRSSRLLTASQSEALLSLADFEAMLGNREQATAAYERAISVEPAFAVARTNFVDFLRLSGDETRAESLLREGLEIDGESAILHHALGLLLVRTARTEAALAELERSAALEPDNARYAYVLGVARHSSGDSGLALATLETAYEQHPADFDIGWAYATILRDAGRIEAARAVTAELVLRFPENRDVQDLLWSLRETG